MDCLLKCSILFLVTLLVSGVYWDYVYPEIPSAPTPSVPEFTVQLVDRSYDVAPTTTSTTNPYNNKTTTTNIDGYHVQNFTVDLTIKNQAYPATLDGNTSYLQYDVQTKGYYANWSENDPIAVSVFQSNSDYTTVSFPATYAAGDEVDFQVRAVLEYGYLFPASLLTWDYKYVRVTFSDWSPTQTFTMPNTSTPTPAQTSNQPFISLKENIWLTAVASVAIAALVLAVTALLLYRRRKKPRKSGFAVSGKQPLFCFFLLFFAYVCY